MWHKIYSSGDELKALLDNRNAHMREHIVAWVNMDDHEPDTNWVRVLGLVADHFAEDAHADESTWVTRIEHARLSEVDNGAIAGLAGHALHACGMTALRFLEISEQSGYDVPGFIIARFILGTEMRLAEHIVLLRLLESLCLDEVQSMICTAQGALKTLGFTADEVRNLRTVSTVDTP